jgi:hypothetical protein
MTRAPDYRLSGQICYRASFVRAFCGESGELVARLQDDDALPAHRDDNEFVLLQLCGFVPRQMRRPGRAGLWQGFEITNNRIRDARDPCRGAGPEDEIEKATPGRQRTGSGLCFDGCCLVGWDCYFKRLLWP